MKRKVLAIVLTSALVLSLGLVLVGPVGADPGPITIWEIGVIDDAYDHTVDGTLPWPGGPVVTTVDYEDESTFYAVLTKASTLTGTFDADLSLGAVLLVSWSPGASAVEQFSVTLDGITQSSKTVTGLKCTSSTVFPYPDGRCGWHSTYSGVPYYTEIFDFGPLGSGISTHTLVISYNTGDGIGFDYLQLTTPEPEEIEVNVDIKPTSCPNPLNVKSKGVLPVAILGTDTFDVTDIDPSTILLEGVAPLRWSFEDVAAPFSGDPSCSDAYACTTDGPDGYMDLTLKFDKQEVVAALGTVEDGDVRCLTLTALLLDTTPISASDVVWILKKGK